MKFTFLAMALAGFSSVAAAQTNTFDFINATYVNLKVDDIDLNATGAGLEASKLLTDNIYLHGSYFSVSDSDSDDGFSAKLTADEIKLSVGYRYTLGENTDWYAQVGYISQEIDLAISSAAINFRESGSADGFLLKTGLKHSWDMFEGGVYVEHADLSGDDDGGSTYFGVDGRFKFNEKFHLVASFATGSDEDYIKFGLSYAF
ncbi:MAG: porin family protein [Paraglaciecola sp.]|uniref:Porin family protein n=1 Tax=Alishewanella maricola TaxID=2795740 RepID=A0ABS8C280_9ALTE|nr:porin family protein [Alishewanella maricola]MCB5226439.1 porin family protein [Alishewanella maricola]MDP5132372.1 porin family protein [Paraglaciecola sp.]